MDPIAGTCAGCGYEIENLSESLHLPDDAKGIAWSCPICNHENVTPIPEAV